MSRRRRKKRLAQARDREERRRSTEAAIYRELDEFARELRKLGQRVAERQRWEIDEEERQRFEESRARPDTWQGRLYWLGLWPLAERFQVTSEEERDLMTRFTRAGRWLPLVLLRWWKK